jgi:hypothetical protein
VSSFTSPHFFYLFEMTTGRKKLAYGASPEDAYEGLRLRLTAAEMEPVLKETARKITQREIRDHIAELG